MMFLKNILNKVFLILIIFILIISCQNKQREKNKGNKKNVSKKRNLITIEKFSFSEFEKGKTRWTLNSKKAIIDNTNKIITLTGVFIKCDNGYIITSKRGKYFMDKKIAELFDSVKILNDNTSFLTNYLKFFSNKDKVETDKGIKVLNKNYILKSKNMIGFINKNKFILTGGVKSIIK